MEMFYLRRETNKVVFVVSEGKKVVSGEEREGNMWYLRALGDKSDIWMKRC